MYRHAFLVSTACLAFVVGCAREENKAVEGKTSRKSDPYVKVEINHDTIKKDMAAFQKKAEDNLQDIGKQIDDLKAQASKAAGEAKEKMDAEIKVLSEKKDVAMKKLADVKNATVETWAELRPQMDAALDDLKTGFEKAISRFKSPPKE